jgi:hypothetical protein
MVRYAEQHLAHFCQTYVASNRGRNKTWPDAVRRLKKEIVRAQLMRYQAEKKLPDARASWESMLKHGANTPTGAHFTCFTDTKVLALLVHECKC